MLHCLSLVSICLAVSLTNAVLHLVFSDDFNRPGGVDENKWTFDIGNGEHGWGNREQQFYTRNRKNVRCERFGNSHNGRLIIEAQKEDYQNARYTSARIRTKHAWRYGVWEIRAKVPQGKGLWSAVWMLPQDSAYGSKMWPETGEINIMEQVGFDPLKIHASVHTEAHNHQKGNNPTNHVTVDDAVNNFKIYTLDWQPHSMSMYVGDDSNPRKSRILVWNKQGGWRMWPFDRPFYLIFNLAVGGDWGGQKADQLTKANIDYAVIGGLAVYEHGYRRTTDHYDLLLTRAGLQRFQKHLVGRDVRPKFEGARKNFICNNTKTPIDIIVQGERPGDGEDVPVEFPDPKTCNQLINGYFIITFPKLIELKLSSSKRLPVIRIQDRSDVVELIKIQNLDKSFAESLHPYVQNDFKELIDLLANEKQKGFMKEM